MLAPVEPRIGADRGGESGAGIIAGRCPEPLSGAPVLGEDFPSSPPAAISSSTCTCLSWAPDPPQYSETVSARDLFRRPSCLPRPLSFSRKTAPPSSRARPVDIQYRGRAPPPRGALPTLSVTQERSVANL